MAAASTLLTMIVIETILLIYFGYVSSYAFLSAVAAHFYRSPVAPETLMRHKFAVLIPSYKEDNVIVSVAQHALEQTYPHEFYDVVVIADSLRPDTVVKLKQLPIKVIEVSFDKSTKVKSLNRAMAAIGDDYDYALILDADNIMEIDFLHKINNLISMGWKVIQAERVSKNENTPMSVLDGLSERINNFIYRQGAVTLGFSASLIGSGMVFEYPVLKKVLAGMDSIGGFDRELELLLIRRNIQIHYAKGIKVYDEKVETTEVFERQRTRWLSSQFIYLKKYFWLGWKALFQGRLSLFNSAILKNIQLPRVLNLGLLFVITVLAYALRKHLTVAYIVWPLLFAMKLSSIALAIPAKKYNRELLKSFLLLPTVFVKMFNLLFKLKGANKEFIHTPHGVSEVPLAKNK
jgi:cellulose synthase/poly-beta-1,6-N-acetylglucosamine synthase-like glycosyltransferase